MSVHKGFLSFSLVLFCVLLSACSKNMSAIGEEGAGFGSTPEEQEIFKRSELLYQEYDEEAMIVEDRFINSYVTTLGNSLVSDSTKDVVDYRFHLLRQPFVNAYATANGRIYINLGMLVKLSNPTQLAYVLAHEIAHVEKRHVYETVETNKSNKSAAHIADLFLFGTNLAYIPFMASTQGHSRSSELEADHIAYKKLSARGYDLSKVSSFYEIISDRVVDQNKNTSMWSSHPGNIERGKKLQEFLDKNKSAKTIKEDLFAFRAMKKRALSVITLDSLEAKKYTITQSLLEGEIENSPHDPELYYLLGETFKRMSGDAGGLAKEYAYLNDERLDDEKIAEFASKSDEYFNNAVTNFNKVRKMGGDKKLLSKVYRSVGVLYYEKGRGKEAVTYLRKYLDISDKIYDRKYINNLIKKAENES